MRTPSTAHTNILRRKILLRLRYVQYALSSFRSLGYRIEFLWLKQTYPPSQISNEPTGCDKMKPEIPAYVYYNVNRC